MFETVLSLHFLGLMMGGGAGFGGMIVMAAMRRGDAATKAALMPLRPKLGRIGFIGISLLWLTGITMVQMGHAEGAMGPLFGLKLLAAAGVLAVAITMEMLGARAKRGIPMPAFAARLPMLPGPLSLIALIIAVVVFQ